MDKYQFSIIIIIENFENNDMQSSLSSKNNEKVETNKADYDDYQENNIKDCNDHVDLSRALVINPTTKYVNNNALLVEKKHNKRQ